MTPEDVQKESLKEMSDKEVAQAYLRLSKAAGMVSNTLNKLKADHKRKERNPDVSERVAEKAKKNAEQAKDRQDELEGMINTVKAEVEDRDINPYELV